MSKGLFLYDKNKHINSLIEIKVFFKTSQEIDMENFAAKIVREAQQMYQLKKSTLSIPPSHQRGTITNNNYDDVVVVHPPPPLPLTRRVNTQRKQPKTSCYEEV